MKTTDLKKDITTIINTIEDENTLLAIKLFIHNQSKDYWNELPEQVKESIDVGIKQAEAGKLTPHNEVMHNIKSKYI